MAARTKQQNLALSSELLRVFLQRAVDGLALLLLLAILVIGGAHARAHLFNA